MFPIRRPCADAVRSGISVLWSSSSTALYSSNGVYTSRIFIKQFQCSRGAFTGILGNPSNNYLDNQQLSSSSSSNTNSQPLTSSATTTQSPVVVVPPPHLNAVLRGSTSSSTTASSPPLLNKSLRSSGDLTSDPVRFAATPKEKERESESELQRKKQQQQQSQQKKAGGDGASSSGGDPDKPSLDQLQKTYDLLQKNLEKIFTHPMDYSVYHPEIVFIDNIRHLRTQGLVKYVQQVALLKMAGHIKFAYVRFDILNMSMSQEEARITVRWRIKGLSGLRVMLKFWKYKLWKWQEIMNHQETWYDGISYFDVGADGKIFQHVADKVQEDKDRSVDEKTSGGRSIPFAAKLGGALGVTAFPSPSLSYENAKEDAASSTKTASSSPPPRGGDGGGGDGGGNQAGRASAAAAAVLKSS